MRLGQKNSSVNDCSLAVYHLHRPDLYFVVCLFFPSAIIMGLMGFFTYKIKTQKDSVLFFFRSPAKGSEMSTGICHKRANY